MSFFFGLVSLLVLTAFAGAEGNNRSPSPGEPPGSTSARRLRPPESIRCPRDHLTSFTGRVLSYDRSAGRISIGMRTDENTSEEFSLSYAKREDPTKWFLLRGQPFPRGDWAVIESAAGRLWPQTRATIWVCDDGSNPIIDWLPPSAGPR